ncbi:hypothetical protein [Halospeciosus flavus]|uniref:Uncharacterized protein n=1 Tax=Halospeciosus flavus TaxID=3032283 RepID=A0ABD5Z5X7_9EURY|nr:hypothetical protein [Halospeciosus flavus]
MNTNIGFERGNGNELDRPGTKMEVSEMPLERALACVEDRAGDAHFERTVGRTYLVTDD